MKKIIHDGLLTSRLFKQERHVRKHVKSDGINCLKKKGGGKGCVYIAVHQFNENNDAR